MSSLGLAILLALAAFAALLLLLRPWRRSGDKALPSAPHEMESFLPRHYRFLPQIRQALSPGDEEFLRKAAPPRVANQVRRERRAIALNFLRGLREDFTNLDRMGRMIAGLSPEVSHQQETERWILGLKFQCLYAVVWLSFFSGSFPLRRVEQLTGLIGRLAIRMEQAMARINALSATQNHRVKV
ncbi:MAG: hypothetical protein ACRD4Y_04440 [Candidatus Acidiferrales bacterium]